VTRGPLANGLLSKQMLAKASTKVLDQGYLDYSYGELAELLPILKEKLAANRSFTEIALHYNLANPAVTSVVTGASSIEQIRENCAVVRSHPLTLEEIELIRTLTKPNQYEQHR
jgi:aryl-alcohol dehydrogenase-like predicted oxidoreductase